MMLAGYILFLVLSLFATCNAENPGLKVRIPQNVLEEAVQYLFNTMTTEISTYNLPDVNGTTTLDSDEMTYKLTEIKIVDFQFENISSKFVPGTGVQISIQRGRAVIQCQCDLDSWLLKDSGPAVLTLSETSIFMLLGVRRVDPGVPLAFMIDCQSAIKQIDFQMLSGISYVYDALKPHIEEVLQRSVSQQLCSALRNQVTQWNLSLGNLKLNFTLSQNVKADLSLTSDPEVSKNYADLHLKGQFHGSNVSTANFSPAPINLPEEVSKSSIGISEASLNSLVAAHYSTGSINDMLSNASKSTNVTTSQLAVAVPEISKHFSSPTPVQIALYATSCPLVNVTAKNRTVDFQGLIQIHAKHADGRIQCLLEANIVTVLNGAVNISNAEEYDGLNVSGSISLQRFQIDKTKPNICEPKYTASEQGIRRILNQILIPHINEKLKQGMKIRSTILKNPSNINKQSYELLAIDLRWV